MPAEIPFPTSSSRGLKPQEGGGRLINAYAEKAPAGAPSKIIWKRSPGLRQIAETADHVHCRGFLDCGGTTVIVIFNERAYSLMQSGGVFVLTNLGALAGTLPVTMARNNNGTPQNVAVTENGVFNLFTGSAPTAFADLDLPVANSVSFLDGYFLFTIGDGRIFASDLNSVSVASNSFATEQGLQLRRGVVYAGRFYAFGDKWTGIYKNAGTSPFPLSREVQMPRGIVGTHAIAGWEQGWSNELMWIGDDFVPYRTTSYKEVAQPYDDVSRDVQAAVLAGDGNLLEAHVYMHGSNAFWTLTYPGHWTWEFNLTTGEWNERESYGEEDWRARRSIKAFDRWIVGDNETGKLAEVSGTEYREYGDPLIFHAESGVVANFPARIVIPRVDFQMTAAVGSSASVTDPQVQIDWSLDGGYSYGNPVLRRLGAEGEAGIHPYITRCGMTKGQGARFRVRVSDPVHVALAGGKMAAEVRAE